MLFWTARRRADGKVDSAGKTQPRHYTAGQRLAASLRAAGANGIVYVNVRRAGGECAAVFRPQLLSNCRQERHLCYVWDGQRVSAIYEKRSLQLRPVKS